MMGKRKEKKNAWFGFDSLCLGFFAVHQVSSFLCEKYIHTYIYILEIYDIYILEIYESSYPMMIIGGWKKGVSWMLGLFESIIVD